MWVFPVFLSAVVVGRRAVSGFGFGLRRMLIGIFLGLTVFVGVLVAGHLTNVERVRLKNGAVTLGTQTDSGLAIDVATTPEVVGLHFGQQIRGRPPTRDWIRYAWDGDRILTAPVVFLTGRIVNPLVPETGEGVDLVWINPHGMFPDRVLARADYRNVTIFSGEFSEFTTAPWRVYLEEKSARGRVGDIRRIRGQAESVTNAWNLFVDRAAISTQ